MPAVSSRTRRQKTGVIAPVILENQLEQVIEREGAIVSFAAVITSRSSRRAKRASPRSAPPLAPVAIPSVDASQALDIKLVQRVRTPLQNGVHRSLNVRFASHAPSAHVTKMEGSARPLQSFVRESFGSTIEGWQAPFEIPPSLDHLSSLTQDLWIDRVDPRAFIEQFTPAHPAIAFHRRYSWWFRALLPVMRWEAQKEGWQRFRRVKAEVKEREEELVTEIEQAWDVPMVVPRLHIMRLMVGFFTLLIIVTIPAGAVSFSRSFGASVTTVKQESHAALSEVQTAVQSGADADPSWQQASLRFHRADQALRQVNLLALGLAQALPQTRERYASAQALLTAGERATQAAQMLARGLTQAFEPGTALHPDERLMTFRTYLDQATPLLEEALQQVHQVHAAALPAEIQPRVQALQEGLAVGESQVQDINAMMDLLLTAVGHDRIRDYLFIFQNNAELRPTGGFMGSVAEISFDRGEIKNFTVPGGGPYDLRGQLLVRVLPPEPLRLVATRWEFQDANWFPDFPEAAQKIRWFWSKAGQPTVDGVVAVNANVLEKLLAITGPIELPRYGKMITAENVLDEMQKAVEIEYDKTENKPKKIVGDLMQEILKRVQTGSREDWLRYLDVALASLDSKDIQIALTHPEEEALVERFGWNGRLKPTTGDALALIEANIGGQKTDTRIREQVEHTVEVDTSGWITDTVELTRTHQAKKGELFHGVNNVSYLRVYVPQGSQLLEATGFQPPTTTLFKIPLPQDGTDPDVARLVQADTSPVPEVAITQEFGRTVFGGWIQLEPGQTSVTRFRYRLPFTAFDLARRANADIPMDQEDPRANMAAYLRLATNQSGATHRTLTTHLRFPSAWQLAWSHDPNAQVSSTLSGPWDRDQVMATLFHTPHVP